MSTPASAPAEDHANKDVVDNTADPAKRNIDVERNRIQELLDTTLGTETARNFKLTGTEAGGIARSAALVAAAESEERSAIDAVLRAPNEAERIKAVRDQLRATQNKVRAQQEFNTIANRANTRVMPERDDAPHSALRTAFREYGVPVAGATGFGAAVLANSLGLSSVSSFLAGSVGVAAYGGGYLGGIVAGSWIGGKIEQSLRSSFGRSAGEGTLGKTIGALASASGMTLMLPGTLPSAAIGAGIYGTYKAYQWLKTLRFRSTPAYRNAVYLRTLNDAYLTGLGKPADMKANILGTNLVLTFDKKEKTVDVSGATSNTDVDLLVTTGIHDLEHEVHEEHNKHNAVKYRTLLKAWTVPKDITLDFSHAYDHRIRYLYKNAGPTTPTPPPSHYEVDCSAFPEDDADAFKNMFDAEIQATIQRVDSADPVNRAKKFTALLKDIKLPAGVEIENNPADAARKIVHFVYGMNTATTPPTPNISAPFDCSAFDNDAVASRVTQRAEAYKKEIDEGRLTPEMKFTALLGGLSLPDGVSLVPHALARRIVRVRYDGNDSHDIDCAPYGDDAKAVQTFIVDNAKQFKLDADNAKLTPAILFTQQLRGIPSVKNMQIGYAGVARRRLLLTYYGSTHPIDCTHVHDGSVAEHVTREMNTFKDRVDRERKARFDTLLATPGIFTVAGMTHERTGDRSIKLKMGTIDRNVDCQDTPDADVVALLRQGVISLETDYTQMRHREINQWRAEYQNSESPGRVTLTRDATNPFILQMNRAPKKVGDPPIPPKPLDATSLLTRDQFFAEVTRRLIDLGWKNRKK